MQERSRTDTRLWVHPNVADCEFGNRSTLEACPPKLTDDNCWDGFRIRWQTRPIFDRNSLQMKLSDFAPAQCRYARGILIVPLTEKGDGRGRDSLKGPDVIVQLNDPRRLSD